ncbi:MAG: glycosyltransferase [Polyangiaceae bacterium]|jgi:glycosyltransferase involved in cell wall biosynthesis|nr:glycosyltransferase [Polyangiaceae bacterium]
MAPARRLLVLASYPEAAAATRFRLCAYFPALRDRGIEPDFRPFLSDEAFACIYRPGHTLEKARHVLAACADRLALWLEKTPYDGVLVQREAAIVGPALLEHALRARRGLPLIFDFDDAIWLDGFADKSGLPNRRFARLLKAPSKTEGLLRRAAHVIAATRFLADYARARNPRVSVVPSVVPAARWRPLEGRLEGAPLNDPPLIGWVGTHSTAFQLGLVLPALRRLHAEGRRFRLRFVGAGRNFDLPGVAIENVPWSAERERDDFARLDIGLAPIQEDPWAEGKGGFKQLQYMAVGVPFASSFRSGAREFLIHDENCLLAEGDESWYRALSTLLGDHAVRARLARAGRRLVEENYSTERQAPRFAEIVASTIAGRS